MLNKTCIDEHCYHFIKQIEHTHHRKPTYKELADLLIKLTETYISNIDREEWQFVTCITPKDIPDYWNQAIEYRKLLLMKG